MDKVMAKYNKSKWRIYAENTIGLIVLGLLIYYCLILITDNLT
jgi:hypothetical protein